MRELRLPGLGCAVVCAGGSIWPAVARWLGGSRSVSEGFARSDQDGPAFYAGPGAAGCRCCCPRHSRAVRDASRPNRASPGSRIRAHPLRGLLRSPAYPFRLRRPGTGPATAGGFPTSHTGPLAYPVAHRKPPDGQPDPSSASRNMGVSLAEALGPVRLWKSLKCSPEPSCLGPEIVRR